MQNFTPRAKRAAIVILAIIVVIAAVLVVNISFNPAGQKSGIQPMSVNNGGGLLYGLQNKLGRTANDSAVPSAYEQSSQAVGASEGQLTQRKIIKNADLSLLVKKAEDAAQKIQDIAKNSGGFVADSRVWEVAQGIKSGTVTIRVPADKLDQALGEIKKLAVKVESENINASDVTEQYIDLEARLKNLRAQEEQFLEIMKDAKSVEETLSVVQYLNNARAQIEQIQGQLQYLSRQVDMSSISVSLTSEADVQVFGIVWRPLYVVKQAFRDMISGLASFVDSMIKLLFGLPVIILWVGLIGLIIYIIYHIGRWTWKKFLAPKPPTVIS